jgi:hypothetical protein
MRKPPETILKKDHDKIVAAKDKIITELADIVDEFQLAYADFTKEVTPVAERARKVINRKSISSVAWPPRRIGEK